MVEAIYVLWNDDGFYIICPYCRVERRSQKGSNGFPSSTQKTATGKKKVGAAAAEKKASVSGTFDKYKKILPLTRVYITLVAVATLLGIILGEELTQSILALDPMRIMYRFELWRPITAATFLGPPSIGWLMSGYYLFEYGSSLERAYGTAQHSHLSACRLPSCRSLVSWSMITAMLHVLSRFMPHQKVKWVIFTVPYSALPYGLMTTDVLQAQSAMAQQRTPFEESKKGTQAWKRRWLTNETKL
jgi:membrane associated rhomboid family serine protease